jgi:hypothetical protein
MPQDEYEFERSRKTHILNYIDMFGPATLKKIEETCGSKQMNVRPVESVLEILVEEGQIELIDGKYTTKGKKKPTPRKEIIIKLRPGQSMSSLKQHVVRGADVIINADGRYLKNRFGKFGRASAEHMKKARYA